MKTRVTKLLLMALFAGLVIGLFSSQSAYAYPPAVGILGKSKDCVACHPNNGPWKDDGKTIIDILDRDTMASLAQPDGTFLITVKRGEPKEILTVIGRAQKDSAPPPYRNAWLYTHPDSIDSSSLSKFAPGWDVNLPMACRVVGDHLEIYRGAKITALPMTIRPTDAARDEEVHLQVMLTRNKAVKGKPGKGMLGSFFKRVVNLKVVE